MTAAIALLLAPAMATSGECRPRVPSDLIGEHLHLWLTATTGGPEAEIHLHLRASVLGEGPDRVEAQPLSLHLAVTVGPEPADVFVSGQATEPLSRRRFVAFAEATGLPDRPPRGYGVMPSVHDSWAVPQVSFELFNDHERSYWVEWRADLVGGPGW